MIKVSIPAFKMRGESAFMECQYELNRTHGPQIISTGHRERDRYTPHAGGELHYVDSADVERQPVHRRTHQGKRQYQQRRQQHQPMAMRQYQSQSQSQSQTERHNPPLPEKSPYGHSVYRGSAASGYLGGRVGASVHSSGAGGGGNGVGGSSSSSGSISYMPDFGRDDRYDESDEEEEETQEEGESLYAIKWYKDNEEFYRYVPKARPPKTSYRVDGVRVIVSMRANRAQRNPVTNTLSLSLSPYLCLCLSANRRSYLMPVACCCVGSHSTRLASTAVKSPPRRQIFHLYRARVAWTLCVSQKQIILKITRNTIRNIFSFHLMDKQIFCKQFSVCNYNC